MSGRRLVIIDYGSGNLHSVRAGFLRAAAGSDLEIEVGDRAEALAAAERIVLPGVGAFADCVRGLTALPGMRAALEERVLRNGVPFLGICVGMQMLFTRGLEHGDHAGLGWISGDVVPITPRDLALKIPHMGWNELTLPPSPHPLFHGIAPGEHVYFVHGFHARCTEASHRLASVEYGETITAAVGRDNIAGVQFHPEKSQRTGERILRNFLEWSP
jgi:glutamine amidotransferase